MLAFIVYENTKRDKVREIYFYNYTSKCRNAVVNNRAFCKKLFRALAHNHS